MLKINHSNTKNREGITLPEIIVATLILCLAMIPIAGLMGYGGKATLKDARRITAIQMLDKTMRSLLSEPFNEIPRGNNIVKSFNNISLGDVKASNGVTYSVKLTSQYMTTSFDYKPVNVHTATFNEASPKPADFASVESLTLTDSILRLSLTISWTEEKSKVVQVSALTYRANFSRRTL
ncbi:MAG: hypothetical protein PHQ02_04635 [Candidatus Riflebacteria bacterium]|nr:hypothetical protein [Candidatus Riflebacteria bacterium]